MSVPATIFIPRTLKCEISPQYIFARSHIQTILEEKLKFLVKYFIKIIKITLTKSIIGKGQFKFELGVGCCGYGLLQSFAAGSPVVRDYILLCIHDKSYWWNFHNNILQNGRTPGRIVARPSEIHGEEFRWKNSWYLFVSGRKYSAGHSRGSNDELYASWFLLLMKSQPKVDLAWVGPE